MLCLICSSQPPVYLTHLTGKRIKTKKQRNVSKPRQQANGLEVDPIYQKTFRKHSSDTRSYPAPGPCISFLIYDPAFRAAAFLTTGGLLAWTTTTGDVFLALYTYTIVDKEGS
jgi:hypothetical protein